MVFEVGTYTADARRLSQKNQTLGAVVRLTNTQNEPQQLNRPRSGLV